MMVTEPERVHFDAPCTEAKLMTGDAEGRRPSLPEDMRLAEPPLVLREDASRVVSRALLAGYSKGGNMVSDAVRLLKDELEGALRHGMLDARPLLKQPELAIDAIPPRQVTSRILSSIGLLSIAAGEEPLTQDEKDAGIRRVNILSDRDLIASHFAAGREHEYHSRDELIRVKGTDADMGHRWQHALLEAPGMATGFIMADKKARQHVQAVSSQLFDGLPAIWDFRLETRNREGREYRLSFRPGVLRRDIEAWGTELSAYLPGRLAKEYSAVRISITPDAPTAIILHVPEALQQHSGLPHEVRDALSTFCQEKGILLPPYVAEDIADQFQQAVPPGQQSRGSHIKRALGRTGNVPAHGLPG
jgi:hypothetical protein